MSKEKIQELIPDSGDDSRIPKLRMREENSLVCIESEGVAVYL